MKRLRKLQRFASTFAFVALSATAILSAPEVHAQSSETKEKIQLMASALRARDAGNLAEAKANLEELLRMNPNDTNVQRLLDAVNKDIERQSTGQPTVYGQAAGMSAQRPSVVTGPGTSDASVDATTPVVLSSAAMGGEGVDNMLAAAATEQQLAIAAGEQAIADAKVLMENGRMDEADALLEEAANAIPESTATEVVLADIRHLRGDIILDSGKEAIANSNIPAARAAAAAYEETLGADERLEKYNKMVEALEKDPWRQDPDQLSPEYVANQRTVDQLLVQARAMMLYGDYDGAQRKLREVEARDPTNPAGKALQMEIMQQLEKTGWLDHQKTRDQMLQEVSRSWQRPQVYDLDDEEEPPDGLDPTREKLQSIFIPRVSFAGVPLSRVVETLSELSVEYDDPALPDDERGVNMVLLNRGDVDPTVSITLRNLNMERILDFVTESVAFQWDVSDETVIISKGETGDIRLETEFFPISRATIIRLTGGGGDTGASAAPADPFAAPTAAPATSNASDTEDDLRSFFERAGIDFNEPGASLAFDGTQLIVTQTPRNLEKLRNILRRYDQPKQVEIEAKFLDVLQGNLDELGFNWSVTSASGRNMASTNLQGLSDVFSLNDQSSNITIDRSVTATGPGGTTVTTSVPTNIPAGAPQIPNAIDLGAVGGTMGSFMGVIQGVDVNLTVNALSRQEGSDLLSAPKLTVLSGRTAQIVVAQELRYPENYGDIEAEVSGNSGGSIVGGSAAQAVAITAGTPQDFSVRNVGVEMEVTPTVEENQNISLKLEPRVTEFEGFVEYGGPSVAISGGTTVTVPSGFFQPIFSTREVRTEVTIFDGATVVIGGLTREEIKTVEDKVPVLGDIPFLGRFFQNKGETAQKRNLLIFVTANLISPGGSPARQSFGETAEANSLFQNPIVVTPGGGVSRQIVE